VRYAVDAGWQVYREAPAGNVRRQEERVTHWTEHRYRRTSGTGPCNAQEDANPLPAHNAKDKRDHLEVYER
jgi:hypothetical protein